MSSPDTNALPEGWTALRELAAGSSGVRVLEARGPCGHAALKLYPATARSAAEAETAALRPLHHPNLPRLVGEGRDPTPWLATAWVGGRHLGEPPAPESRPEHAAALLAQFLGALSFLHARSLAHGDLHGRNLRLDGEGRLVLVDLGLAGRLGGEPTGVSGAPGYLAPERLAGGAPSVRADLFGAGLLVLELLGGPAAVAQRRLGEPADLPPDLPEALVSTLEALTELEPQHRPESAGLALEPLLTLLPSPLPPALSHLRDDLARRPVSAGAEPASPPLVGRGPLLERLHPVLERTREGEGTFVLLCGEAGLGRSRLIEELGRRGRAAGLRVLSGRCREAEPGGQGPLREALAPLAAELARRPVAEIAATLGPDARALGFACPEMLELPWVSGLPDPDDLSPDLNKFRVFSAVTNLLRTWSRREPLLLAVDDVQWADHATMELLYHLQRNVVHGAATFGESGAGGALTLVLTRREDADAENDLVAKTIADARRCGAFFEAKLQRLLPAQVGELVAGMLPGAAPSSELVDLVAGESAGVPQLAVALVTSLHAEGLLLQAGGGWRLADRAGTASGRLADMLRRRTDRLGSAARALLSAGAVLGRDFDPLLAAEAAGLDEAARVAAIEELHAARVLTPSAGGRVGFAQEQLRRLMLDEMEGEERRARHGRVMRALQSRRARGEAGTAAELARHALAAGEPAVALEHLPIAAAELRLAGSTAEALELLRRQVELLEALPREERRLRAREDLQARQTAAEILVASDRWREASEAFFELLGACRSAGDVAAEARALVGLGRTENLTGSYAEAKEHLERALELARSQGDARDEAMAMVFLIQNAYMRGRFEEAEALHEPALTAATALGDRQALAEALRQVGLSHHLQGRTEQAIPLCRDAQALLEAVGDRRNAAATLHNLGILHNARGEHAVAMDCYERSLSIFRELGRRHDTASCLTNIGNVHRQRGAAGEAERRYLEAQSIYRELEDRRGAADNLSNLGEVDVMRGRHARGRDRYAQALAVYRDMGSRAKVAFACCNLASAQLHLGQLDEAEARVREALEIDRELGSPREVAYDRAVVAGIHARRGEGREALAELERALGEAREGGDRFHAAQLLGELAESLQDQGRSAEARRRAEEALREARALGAREVEVLALALLGAVGAGPEAEERRGRALELTASLESPEVALRVHRRVALSRLERGELEGAREAMDRAVASIAEIARSLADDARGFLARPDIARVLAELLELEETSGQPRIESVLDSWHLLAGTADRARALSLLSARLGGGQAEGPELRRLRTFHELVTGADLASLDGLLATFLGRLLELVEAERGLLFLLEGSELRCRLGLGRSGSRLSAPERAVPRQVLDWVLRRRRGLITEDAALDDRLDYRASVEDLNVRSLLATPLFSGDELLGLVYVDRRARGVSFTAEARADFEATCGDLAQLLANARRAEEREAELHRLRETTARPDEQGLPGLIGDSPAIRRLSSAARLTARSNESVLITGESGTGKEVLARALHALSPRSGRPFVALDCGAMPETLVESVLFGHAKGAFTGADRDRPGVFEEAEGGTLFLDEIANASWDVQARLLRVLQEREVRRVGGATLPVDVRVIAASNRDPEGEVAAGRLREDLFYRLAVIPLHLPPLRERLGDVVPIAEAVLREVAERDGKPLEGFTAGALRLLQEHDWPGNVRELRNVVARMAAFCAEGRVDESRVPDSVRRSSQAGFEVDLQSDAAESILASLLSGEQDFWQAVREPLRARDITKEQVRSVLAAGLERTRGSYKRTARLFGLGEDDYTRFMDFLRFNDLKLDFRPFRKATGGGAGPRAGSGPRTDGGPRTGGGGKAAAGGEGPRAGGGPGAGGGPRAGT